MANSTSPSCADLGAPGLGREGLGEGSEASRARSRNRRQQQQAAADSATTPQRKWYASTAAVGLAGAGMMWLSLPPVNWGGLGWFAPICWLVLIQRDALSGRRPYRTLYFVGWVFFGATFYWITLPHPSSIIGWIGLSTYLAIYIVLFVGLSRVAVHQLRLPLMLVTPVVWTGLELVRAHFGTGFLMAALSHTQYSWLGIIQISDLCGAYGVSFLVMFVAACLASMLPRGDRRARWWPLAPATAALVAALAYGQYRTHVDPGQVDSGRKGPKVALVQGSIDTEFGGDPTATRRRVHKEYFDLTMDALSNNEDVDLVVWPESMGDGPLITINQNAWLPTEMLNGSPLQPGEAERLVAEKKLPQRVYDLAEESHRYYRFLMDEFTAASRNGDLQMLVGVDGQEFGPGWLKRYNTSVHLDSEGHVQGRYDKMHPVMFGEYVPLGDTFPALYSLTPLAGGLTPGSQALAIDVQGCRIAPNICYETVLPQVIRRQIRMLEEDGRAPDLLVTQTNDGWFWGSAALDMHLICGVFRAVEFRKPLLIAANTGLSALITSDGRIAQKGPRRGTEVLVVQPRIDSRSSLYLATGDWFAGLCALACLGLCAVGIRSRLGQRQSRARGPSRGNTAE